MPSVAGHPSPTPPTPALSDNGQVDDEVRRRQEAEERIEFLSKRTSELMDEFQDFISGMGDDSINDGPTKINMDGDEEPPLPSSLLSPAKQGVSIGSKGPIEEGADAGAGSSLPNLGDLEGIADKNRKASLDFASIKSSALSSSSIGSNKYDIEGGGNTSPPGHQLALGGRKRASSLLWEDDEVSPLEGGGSPDAGDCSGEVEIHDDSFGSSSRLSRLRPPGYCLPRFNTHTLLAQCTALGFVFVIIVLHYALHEGPPRTRSHHDHAVDEPEEHDPNPSVGGSPAAWYHQLACGGSDGECRGQTLPASNMQRHHVRCCSDTPVAKWWRKEVDPKCRAKLGRDVWGESRGVGGTCHGAVDHDRASTICSSIGGRLCTAEELLADCAKSTGCSFDQEMIWTSTVAVLPTTPPVSPSAVVLTQNPTVATASEPTVTSTQEPTPIPRYKVVCGSSSWACSGQTLSAGSTEKHHVRCCSDKAVEAWGHGVFPKCLAALGRKVWGGSEMSGTCHSAKDHDQASAICSSNGGRLCTEEELLADCTKSTGCQFDKEMIWSSTVAALPATPPASPSTVERTQHPTVATALEHAVTSTQEPTPTLRYKVVCGSITGVCSGQIISASSTEKHHVRCCSDTHIVAWGHGLFPSCVDALGRKVWGESEMKGTCHSAEDHVQASAICSANGGRLCTEEELLAGCTRSTGCAFDQEMIWSSTVSPTYP